MDFIFKSRVYYSDTDCGGIVYHARYLDFAEHARSEMLRTALPKVSQNEMRNDGMIFVVKSIKIDYKKPAYLDDELTVHTRLMKAEHFSAVFSQEIKRGDDDICFLEVKVAALSFDGKRIMMIPKEVIQALS